MTAESELLPARPDGRRERGARTRRSILEAAASLASREGLEGLSIGRLAAHLGISKSGLYAHFRSKEELQLATIRTAAELYERDLVGPALEHPPGRRRLLAYTDSYLEYVRSGPFPGGCFFVATFLDPASLRGPVRALLASIQQEGLDFIAECIRDAQSRGEIGDDRSPDQIAFEVDALMAGADLNYILFDDPGFLEQGLESIHRVLDGRG